jgi:riboflavin kinase/FMN adenylyltransferase
MHIINDLENLEKPLINPVLTIGNFDGVHKGHIILFDKVKERAKALHGQSVVMTFEPHPIRVMKPGNGPPLITPMKEKLDLILETEMDFIFCLPFTREFAAISAQDFVKDILIKKIGIKEIVVGYDYTFGHNRLGDLSLLREMGGQFGFGVHIIEPIYINRRLVSSTSIRKLVREGDLIDAGALLGRHYQICGTVIKGDNRGGRLLGFPTANLKVVDELIPRMGVYAVTVNVDDNTYNGVTNIGTNPTFGEHALSVETHLLDFSGDLLGKTIRVNFIQRLRNEKSFNSIKELSDQITEDIRVARELF